MNSRFVFRTLVILAVVAACLAAPADNNNKKTVDDVISNSVLPESERSAKADSTVATSADKDTEPEQQTSYNDYISSVFQIPISILQAVRDLFTGGARQA